MATLAKEKENEAFQPDPSCPSYESVVNDQSAHSNPVFIAQQQDQLPLPRQHPSIHFNGTRKYFRQLLCILPGILTFYLVRYQVHYQIDLIEIFRRSYYSPAPGAHVPTDASPLEAFALVSVWHLGVIGGSAYAAAFKEQIDERKSNNLNAFYILCIAFLNAITAIGVFYKFILNFCVISSGMIYGINHVTIIGHAADNSSNETRTFIVRLIPYLKWLLILFPTSELVMRTKSDFVGWQSAPMLIVVACAIAITSHYTTTNSVVRSLRRNDDRRMILDEIAKLHGGNTNDAERTLDELKAQLDADSQTAPSAFAKENRHSLFLVGAGRVVSVLANSLPLTLAFILVPDFSIAFSMVFLLKLCAGALFVGYSHFISLHRFYYICSLFWGVVSLVLLVSSPVIFAIDIIFMGFVGFTLDAISYNQLAEAFPLNKRAWSIATIHIVEHSVEIILYGLYFLSSYAVIACACIAAIAASIYLLRYMPDSSGPKRTLREASDLYKNKVVNEMHCNI